MGPHSWVATSSSSSESLDPCLIADGEYGMPKQCYCGGDVFLETSYTAADPGRRYFTCRNRDQEGYHIRKWWDNVIHDEIEILHSDIRSLTENSQSCGKAEEALAEITTLWTDLCVAERAIADVKGDFVEMKEGYAKMEALVRDLNKKHTTVEITFVVAAFVMFLGLFIIWFK